MVKIRSPGSNLAKVGTVHVGEEPDCVAHRLRPLLFFVHHVLVEIARCLPHGIGISLRQLVPHRGTLAREEAREGESEQESVFTCEHFTQKPL